MRVVDGLPVTEAPSVLMPPGDFNAAQLPCLDRRSLLGSVGAMTAIYAASQLLAPTGILAESVPAYGDIASAYEGETEHLGKLGVAQWASLISVVGPHGERQEVVDAYADAPCEAASVNKVFAATTLLAYADRGILSLDQKVAIPEDLADPGESRRLAPVETLGNLVREMIINSSNEAFRAVQAALPGSAMNSMLWELGLRDTQFWRAADTPRYFTGITTPRDAHKLLLGLSEGNLISKVSSELLLGMLFDTTYHLGVERDLTTDERARTASKYGRTHNISNEIGAMFDTDSEGKRVPKVVWALFANTRIPSLVPLAHARLGRTMMNVTMAS